MKRRRVLAGISIITLGFGAGGFAGWKYFKARRKPNVSDLESHKELITHLVDIIIPETDTPGAKTVGVQDFIMLMIRDCLGRIEQNNFIDGLNDLQSYSYSNHQKSFQKCTAEEKRAILLNIEQSVSGGIIGKVQNKIIGKPFFSLLKSLTIEGYCTSEPGANHHLSYQYIPGTYESCIDMKTSQKSWATI